MTPFDPASAHEVWRSRVLSLTGVLDENSNTEEINKIKEDLLLLHVNSSDRGDHLEIILSLSAMERQEPGALNRLKQILMKIR
ncbi:MAG: hypothetical protein ABIB04_01375 [Patescibacteria group bacterium]